MNFALGTIQPSALTAPINILHYKDLIAGAYIIIPLIGNSLSKANLNDVMPPIDKPDRKIGIFFGLPNFSKTLLINILESCKCNSKLSTNPLMPSDLPKPLIF